MMDTAPSRRDRKPLPNTKIKENVFPIVAIGASAGGLDAVSGLLRNLPSDTGMAFIYVQHLSPDHESSLTTILGKITQMKVQEIENMEHIAPNNVYVIPPNKGIEVVDGHIRLLPHSTNISIDILFTSLSLTHKDNVIGIILSGYATDGTIGIMDIKKAGGLTFAQDDSAQAGSMPNSAIASGSVDYVLSPEDMALELIRFSQNGFKRSSIESELIVAGTDHHNANLNAIFELLLKETGVDFSHYKMPTIKRRLHHKMLQCGVKTIADYEQLLLTNVGEVELLYKDLLINVTSFFRDPDAFLYLKTTLLAKLIKSKSPEESLRIWVPACSSGEEAYSIAMMVTELQDSRAKKIPVQIFATDLSEQAIRDARLGEYSQSDVKAVSDKYLERFFTKVGDKYVIIKELRELCVFAPHNILRDPPFSRMDFISCCNLLIYFDTAAQKKVFATLHFALNETGFLMLGKAETTGTSSQLFSRVNNNYKIYSRKKNVPGARRSLELSPRFPRTHMVSKKSSGFPKSINSNPTGIEDAIDAVLLKTYMPACVVVNKEMEILQFRGPISIFLEHSSGRASLSILKMTRPEFAFELRNAILKVFKTKQPVQQEGMEIEVDSVLRMMSFEVSPLKIEWDEPLLLIVFTLKEQVENFFDSDHGQKNNSLLKDRRIKKLTEELNTMRAEMNAIIESQEVTYEELQAANEEIVSSNEEFQTLNEELETSKEEIEATNEELLSTNQELQIRNDLLCESYEYSEAIIATIHEPMIVLHKDFRVKSANHSFYSKFGVSSEDTEGQSLFDLGNKQWDIVQLRENLQNILLKNSSFQNFEVSHKFPDIGKKIMLLNGHQIVQKAKSEQLILLAIADVTEIRNLAIELHVKETKVFAQKLEEENRILKNIADSEERYRNLIQSLPVAVYTCDTNGLVQLYNTAAIELWGRKPQIGKDLWCGAWKLLTPQGVPLAFENSPMAISQKERRAVLGQEIIIERPDGKRRFVLQNPLPVFDEKGELTGSINTLIDITDQKRNATELLEAKVFAELATGFAEDAKSNAEAARQIAEDAVKAKQQFLSNMSHEIRTPMNAIIGFTKVVLKTDLNPKQMEYLQAIKLSGDALIVLINDILDLAKVDAGKMTFEQTPFKMALSIAAMLHLFETKIWEKNLELVKEYDCNIPDVLVGDPVRLHQIILNLVSNAVKFTNQGKITVSVHLLREDDESVFVEFIVSDTGIGIAEDKIDKIFENFQQASSDTSRMYGGTGLGLAIVKQLVEPQGGTIHVESKLNEGSSFSFVLPFKKTTAEAESEVGTFQMDKSTKCLKVLVAEDIALNQLLMKTLLDDFGFQCDMADNGQIAVEKLKVNSYDIILMDLQMPVMNGFEATDYIRNTLKLKIPIIALTADVTTVDVAKCKAVGMNDYIAKPVDEKLLYRKIINAFKKPSLKSGHPKTLFGKSRCVDLTYLRAKTKGNAKLMMEMIRLYLVQTPPLIAQMNQGLHARDWSSLNSAVHKIFPSFYIMGMNKGFELIAKQIESYHNPSDHFSEMQVLVLKLETACTQAARELEIEYELLKNGTTVL